VGASAAPAKAATFPIPVCGHNLPMLQVTRCGAYDFEMGFIKLSGHDLTVNGLVGNFSTHTVYLPWPLKLVIYHWPQRWRILAVGHPTQVFTDFPAYYFAFQTVFHLPHLVHQIGVYWVVPGTGGKFISWHVHV
jgi:hypothetical protein